MIYRLALVACLFAGLPAWAQTPPEAVDLATILSLAREASPRLALERQNIAVAHAERNTAGAYPNPTVSYNRSRQPGELTNFGSKKAQEVSIEQPLLIAGQRGARIEAAERGIDAARARFAASGNDLAADAGTAYIALLAAQEKRAALVASLAELNQLRNVVAGRQASGMASQYDLLRVDIEQAAWRTRTAEAEAELADRQAQLAALLGLADWKPVGKEVLQPLNTRIETADGDRNNPTLAATRKEEAAAQASTEVARRERFPSVSLTAGRFWTSDPFGATNTIGVAVEIPILDTRGGALDKARAEAQMAMLRRRLAEAEVRADLQRYSALVTQRAAALEHFQQHMEPRLPALKQMAEDSYRLGKSSILELLDATRTRYETQLSRQELIAGLMEAQLRLQAARGDFSAASGLND